MEKFIIQGGKELHGSVRLGGAKNVSFKVMIAALLAKGQSRLLNVPQINDVQITRNIITYLGGKVHSSGERTLYIDTTSIAGFEIPETFGRDSRASTMFVGPLLARFKRAVFPLPGGDKIGRRPDHGRDPGEGKDVAEKCCLRTGGGRPHCLFAEDGSQNPSQTQSRNRN